MTETTAELLQLRERNRNVALVLDSYAALERIYHEALTAMGYLAEALPPVSSTAIVSFSSIDVMPKHSATSATEQ